MVTDARFWMTTIWFLLGPNKSMEVSSQHFLDNLLAFTDAYKPYL